MRALATGALLGAVFWIPAQAFGQEVAPWRDCLLHVPAALSLESDGDGEVLEGNRGSTVPPAASLSLDRFSDARRSDTSRLLALGLMGGYLNARGDEHGAWYGGLFARLYLLSTLAVEASLSVHEDKFADGDVVVTQWPVQLTGLWFPFRDLPIAPYVLGGVGWYYTNVHTRGSLSSISDETDSTIGGHAGLGVELRPPIAVTIFADARYIFIRPSTEVVAKADFSFWQLTLGAGITF